MKNPSMIVLLAAGLWCVGGCAHNESLPASTVTPSTAGTPQAGAVSASTVSGRAGGVHGTVAERIDVPSYTYLRIKTAKGDVWVAVPTHAVAVGTEVTIPDGVPMERFESKTLKRTFDVILFASGVQPAGAASASAQERGGVGSAPGTPPPAGDAPAGNPHVGNPHVGNPHVGIEMPHGDTSLDPSTDKVAKADGPNGFTVAEVFEKGKALANKSVSVHARVVKITPGVLDRNWLHLRDGSGSDADKNNDLVVTTRDEVVVGDAITITGVVHTDKDVGAGYAYPVLVEDAKVTR